MDWASITAFITALAALIGAIAGAYEVWAKYRREHPHNRDTVQPPPPRPSPPTQYPPSQPRQTGFLSSKIARRSVLLGSTALGLVLIVFSTDGSFLPFLLGNSIILVGGMCVCVWRYRGGRRAAARAELAKYGMGLGVLLYLLSLVILVGLHEVLEPEAGFWWWFGSNQIPQTMNNSVVLVYFGGLIIYLTSIYIGRW